MGDAKAQLKLGLNYDTGNGVKQDHIEAVKWYKLAASQGNATAQGALALSYANGEGTPQDYNEAAKWFQLSAEQGNVVSQYSLGVLCSGGQIPSRAAEAAKWFRLAAAQGYGKARYNLGILYEHGTGVQKDLVRAYMWFGFAAESNESAVREAAGGPRDRVAAQLTVEQVTEADTLATKCRSSNWKDCD